MRWLNKWFSFSWKKLALVAALVPVMWLCNETEFRRVDSFILDLMQFLNDPKDVNRRLVTVNINGKKDTFQRPFKIDTFQNVIDKLISLNPKQIILCFSIRELNEETKKELIKYLKDKENIYIQNDYSFPTNNFYKDPLFKDFPRLLAFSGTIDSRDKKARRILLFFDKEGITDEFEVLNRLGFQPKNLEHFKYHFRLWETTQINFKSFQVGTFGSFDAREIIDGTIPIESIKDKTILLGSFDEYSMSSLASIFNFADKTTGDNFKQFYFPHTDNMANMLNTFLTGDYVKTLPKFNDLYITALVLILLILVRVPNKHKIILLISIIPAYLLLVATIYYSNSFYLDFSRSVILLFFLQYLGVPIIMLSMFKEQETKKLQEINDARIDALLTVSEKVAHDIRSPLSAINLIAEKATFPDSEYKEIFDGAIKRIDETATKILTQYRTSTGRDTDKIEQVNLVEIINSLTKEKKLLISKVEFEIVVNSDKVFVWGLQLDIERIISNILDNSIFALKNIINPTIFIAIDETENMLRLSISDNGTGIPEQILKVIGNTRITTKSESNQGNGIGLLHAKRVIERLKGTFEISSQEHVGTTIRISLPKA